MGIDFKEQKTEGNICGFTAREHEVLYLLVQGFSYPEVAKRMYISETTVKTHCNNIFQKVRPLIKGDVMSLQKLICLVFNSSGAGVLKMERDNLRVELNYLSKKVKKNIAVLESHEVVAQNELRKAVFRLESKIELLDVLIKNFDAQFNGGLDVAGDFEFILTQAGVKTFSRIMKKLDVRELKEVINQAMAIRDEKITKGFGQDEANCNHI